MWLRARAQVEVARAFNSLGAMYASGWGTEKNKMLGRSDFILMGCKLLNDGVVVEF